MWFKAKRYGWGWYPSTWQGWLILAVFVAALTWNAFRFGNGSQTTSDLWYGFIPQTLLMVLVLLAICWYTGEKPRWRWGKDT